MAMAIIRLAVVIRCPAPTASPLASVASSHAARRY